jgi:D-alanine-D-alanine ligase
MRIVFAHNLQTNSSEEEAEFDRPETVQTILEALVRLGHEVEPVEVSGSPSRVMARIESLAPDLIFNTAERKGGRMREAFYPALFEGLGIPFTGSDAYTCAVTLDKQLTKLLLRAQGVLTPRWMFVEDPKMLNVTPVHEGVRADTASPKNGPSALTFPVIIKPNYEKSSKGITQESVVERPEDFRARLHRLLERFPAGVLVEEFIQGRDIAVPFLQRASKGTGGVLEAAEYSYEVRASEGRKYDIYDYRMKQLDPDSVHLQAPAALSPEEKEHTVQLSRRIFRTIGVRDFGRIDYRMGSDGKLYFIEVNALPSLEAGSSIYLSAEATGVQGGMDGVLDAIVRSAADRFSTGKPKAKRRGLKVGLTFNLKRVASLPSGEVDQDAEYDSPKVIVAVKEAISSHGHEVVELEATAELPGIIGSSGVDVVFNMAEGIRGRNREAQIPALLELLDIPYSGSDAATMSLALDKGLAKRVVAQAGVPTAPFVTMHTGKERLPKEFVFPVIVKPVAEGSSKGVLKTSVVENELELRDLVKVIIGKYKQAALVEAYLEGREFTVALLGEKRVKMLPPMEIVFINKETRWPVYAFDHKLDWSTEIRYDRPAQVEAALAKELERVARGAFVALGCRDLARIDLRMDGRGRVNFLEVNPLPGLSPGWSDLCLIAESAGLDYRGLIGEILEPAIRRYRDQKRQS